MPKRRMQKARTRMMTACVKRERTKFIGAGSVSSAPTVGGLRKMAGALVVAGTASPGPGGGGLREMAGALVVAGTASPGRSVGGLRKMAGASFVAKGVCPEPAWVGDPRWPGLHLRVRRKETRSTYSLAVSVWPNIGGMTPFG